MVIQLNNTSPTARPPSSSTKLELSSSLEQSTTSSSPSRLRRWSNHRCPPILISVSRCLPVSMEATKALALKWKRKSSSLSLRRSSSTKSTKKEAKAAAEEARAQAVRDTFVQQEAARRESLKVVSTNTDPVPSPASVPDVLPAAKSPSTTNLDAPSNPSPGSDISPTTQAPSNPANGGDTERETTPASPNADYFTLSQLTGASPPSSAPPGKISFSIPDKTEGANGDAQQERPDSHDDSDVAVSSATPSTMVSPRGSVSVDDGATDAGRSSIVSFNGGGSRNSSTSSPISLIFRMPNGSLSQGRPRGSITSRRGDSSPSAQPDSRYVQFNALLTFFFFLFLAVVSFCCLAHLSWLPIMSQPQGPVIGGCQLAVARSQSNPSSMQARSYGTRNVMKVSTRARPDLQLRAWTLLNRLSPTATRIQPSISTHHHTHATPTHTMYIPPAT